MTGGTLIVVVGPSGAGKDTIIDYARTRLADRPEVMFVRRIVTRDPQAGGEDHESMEPAAFADADRRGEFAFTWRAHGLSYAFPAALDDHLKSGEVAVANGSRATLPQLAQRFPELLVINLTVSRANLASRLAARGRESQAEIESRLDRAEQFGVDLPNAVTLSNDGPVGEAGEELVRRVKHHLQRQHDASAALLP